MNACACSTIEDNIYTFEAQPWDYAPRNKAMAMIERKVVDKCQTIAKAYEHKIQQIEAEKIEKVARVINPLWWERFDKAVAPFITSNGISCGNARECHFDLVGRKRD